MTPGKSRTDCPRPAPSSARRRLTLRMSTISIAILLSALASCGSGGGSTSADGSTVVGRVGGAVITRSAVNHRLLALAGKDYYSLSHEHVLPAGLVSDPANYARCLSRLKMLARPNRPVESSVLIKLCHDLNQAVKLQAMSSLIQERWLEGLDRELGIVISPAEVMQLHRRRSAREYPSHAALAAYLERRRMSLSDLLSEDREDVLANRTIELIKRGGRGAYQRVVEAGQRWTRRTSCRPGYVVEHCREYKGQSTTVSPSVAVERLAAIVTGLCVDRAACLGVSGSAP
jgi:hypothetical protein